MLYPEEEEQQQENIGWVHNPLFEGGEVVVEEKFEWCQNPLFEEEEVRPCDFVELGACEKKEEDHHEGEPTTTPTKNQREEVEPQKGNIRPYGSRMEEVEKEQEDESLEPPIDEYILFFNKRMDGKVHALWEDLPKSFSNSYFFSKGGILSFGIFVSNGGSLLKDEPPNLRTNFFEEGGCAPSALSLEPQSAPSIGERLRIKEVCLVLGGPLLIQSFLF